MIALTEELYPTFRWFLFDGSARYAAPVTVFGSKRAALYLGGLYLVLTSAEQVRALSRHFDGVVRDATVQPTSMPRVSHPAPPPRQVTPPDSARVTCRWSTVVAVRSSTSTSSSMPRPGRSGRREPSVRPLQRVRRGRSRASPSSTRAGRRGTRGTALMLPGGQMGVGQEADSVAPRVRREHLDQPPRRPRPSGASR